MAVDLDPPRPHSLVQLLCYDLALDACFDPFKCVCGGGSCGVGDW
jgi:hypothetical protein